MSKKKQSKRFRRISHPRKNLELSDEYKNILRFRGEVVPYVSHGAVHTELLNYVDPYDVGLDIGNKAIRHVPSRDKVNTIFFDCDKKPDNYTTDKDIKKRWDSYVYYKQKEIDNTKFNADKVRSHITKQKKWYWTGNPFSPERLLGIDVDNRTDNSELIKPFLEFFQRYYPDCFYDHGSSGKSLHYYTKLDMLPLYDYYMNNTDISEEWASYANKIIKYTGSIFKIYGRNILCPDHTLISRKNKSGEIKITPEYLVEFDAFKGTCPEYDFYINKQGKPVITKMIKNGVLHKYPNLYTVDDLVKFRDSPIYSIIDHISLSLYLISTILLSGCYSDNDLKKIKLVQKVIEPILIEHSVYLPLLEKNVVASSPSPHDNNTEKRDNNILSIYTGTFENIDDISMESDALIRSKRYLYYCYMEYMTKEGREPSLKEYRDNYRCDIGTGPEDEEDIKRLEYVYYTNIERMRKYLFGSLSQRIEKMESSLGITQDDIDNMSEYDRKLYLREVAITAVWIELCLTNSEYLDKKIWWNINKVQHFNRELTVPMTSLENFIKCLKDKGLNKNGCNPRKAKALREVLVKLGWMQCVDDSVVIAAYQGETGGRARRYILLPDHPGYQRFENIVGVEKIDYWKEFRVEQLQNRKNKGRMVG